jgi:hypothetical protein
MSTRKVIDEVVDNNASGNITKRLLKNIDNDPNTGAGSTKLLTAGENIRTIKHHIFNAFHKPTKASKKYIKFFEDRGLTKKIRDKWTVEIPEKTHKEWIHKAGRNWTTKWKRWIDANPNATTKEVYQQAGKMMDEAGLSGLPLVPYR